MIAEQTLYFLNGHGSQVLDFTGDYTFFIDIPFLFQQSTTVIDPNDGNFEAVGRSSH